MKKIEMKKIDMDGEKARFSPGQRNIFEMILASNVLHRNDLYHSKVCSI